MMAFVLFVIGFFFLAGPMPGAMPSHVARFGSESQVMGSGESHVSGGGCGAGIRADSKLETCQALAIRPEGMVERVAPSRVFAPMRASSARGPGPRRQPRRLSRRPAAW